MSRHGKRLLREWLFKATCKKCRGRRGSFTESGAARETIRCSGGPGRGGTVIGSVLNYKRVWGHASKDALRPKEQKGRRQKEGK